MSAPLKVVSSPALGGLGPSQLVEPTQKITGTTDLRPEHRHPALQLPVRSDHEQVRRFRISGHQSHDPVIGCIPAPTGGMGHPHPAVHAFGEVGQWRVENQDRRFASGGHEALQATEQLPHRPRPVPPPPGRAGPDHVHGVDDEAGHGSPLYSWAMAITTSGAISGLSDEDITTLIGPDIRLQNGDGGDTGDDTGDQSDPTDQGDPSDSNDATDQGDPSDEGDSADQ